ncbi:MAG: hypothetical protein ABEI57_07655 [Halapricum sp.]
MTPDIPKLAAMLLGFWALNSSLLLFATGGPALLMLVAALGQTAGVVGARRALAAPAKSPDSDPDSEPSPAGIVARKVTK